MGSLITLIIIYWVVTYYGLAWGLPLLLYLARFLLLAHGIALVLIGKALLWSARHFYRFTKHAALLLYFLIDELRRGDTGEDAQDEYADDEDEQADTADGPCPIEAAAALLGLGASFTQDELKRAYKAAIRKAHPDIGGSVEEAQQINSARDLLMRAHGWA